MKEEYQSRNLQILEVADGYQLCTRHEFNDWIRKFLKLDRSSRLSQPSLDALSIIAYKQPLTRQELDDIRGVDFSGVIKTLLEKKSDSSRRTKKSTWAAYHVSHDSKVSGIFWIERFERFADFGRFKRRVGWR